MIMTQNFQTFPHTFAFLSRFGGQKHTGSTPWRIVFSLVGVVGISLVGIFFGSTTAAAA